MFQYSKPRTRSVSNCTQCWEYIALLLRDLYRNMYSFSVKSNHAKYLKMV